nr:hypothetical protein [Nocardia sp. CC227C]
MGKVLDCGAAAVSIQLPAQMQTPDDLGYFEIDVGRGVHRVAGELSGDLPRITDQKLYDG